ncbi:MAG: type II toxin-antitoxin system VapC family toxin [Propionibacteriaceae bacterium]|nr:type II toxin-antitoxin system VapC family toxin [Propionibacteriaceae bacterium]
MIILDTNIVSVLVRPEPLRDPVVTQWLTGLPVGETHITAVTRAELLYGLAVMPPSRRKDALILATRRLLEALETLTEPFDTPAADQYAQIVAHRRRAGRPISVHDAQIAAIAQTRSASLATRNLKDFDGLGLRLVNPHDRESWT